MLIEAFFKEFDNSMCEVPEKGPVLLACGPHANQLVDSIVVLKSLYKRVDIGFLTASKTMKSKYFGQMARILRSIPVTRPQDEAVSGRVRVSVIDTKLRGHEGTKFTKDLSEGDTIMILLEDNKTKLVSRVIKILDDTQAELKAAPVVHDPKGEPCCEQLEHAKESSLLNLLDASKKYAPTSFDVPQPRKYKIIPKLDQSVVFSHVIVNSRKVVL